MTDQPLFITGESDPADFTVDQVAAHLATASPQEVERVQGLESDGKGRKGILDLDVEAAQEEAYQEAVADLEAPRLAVGDTYETDGGYTAVVVSVD